MSAEHPFWDISMSCLGHIDMICLGHINERDDYCNLSFLTPRRPSETDLCLMGVQMPCEGRDLKDSSGDKRCMDFNVAWTLTHLKHTHK